MVVDDEPIVVNEAGEIPKKRSTRRGSDHRRSISDLFEEENKSSEGCFEGGLYRAREHRTCDHQSSSLGSLEETPDTRSEKQEKYKIASDSIDVLDNKDHEIVRATEAKATFKIPSDPIISSDPENSARGDKGGRVTSARQLFEDKSNQTKSSTGISVADKKKSYSLPPNLLLTSSRKASTGLVQVESPKEGVSVRPDGVHLQGRRSKTSVETPSAGSGAAVGKLRELIERYKSVTSATAK